MWRIAPVVCQLAVEAEAILRKRPVQPRRVRSVRPGVPLQFLSQLGDRFPARVLGELHLLLR
jgi:hypothetical protein